MTMVSFRVSEPDAADLEQWATALGVDRSELLRDALHRHLASLRGKDDDARWEATPLTEDERSLGEIADWGPAEEWADWDDEAR